MSGSLLGLHPCNQSSQPMNQQPTVALVYDFDGTLAPGNMQEYDFIPAVGKSNKEFWSESNELEKKPEEIWPEYYMADFNLDREKLQEVAERLAGMWEVTYYHRELRPKVKETLEELKKRGYHLGVISNTASLYSVLDVLEQYGIRDYFEDVTLSSVTGYRKPHPSIFQISLRQMQAKPEECAYVGDTISRDIIGAKRMHFGAAIQIQSFLSAQKDAGVDAAYQPDHIIRELPELVDYLEERNRAERLTMQ